MTRKTPEERQMDGLKDRAKGKINEVAGAARGDLSQELKGKVQKNVGKAKQEIGKHQAKAER